jgi:RHS repeat-associated protein
LQATNLLAYDLNGNMLTNGTEILIYDDENQLVTNYVASAWKSEFVYDSKFRRRIERDYTWSGAWVLTNETRFIYDGNVIIQHRDANNLPTLTLTRGRDLSGSLQGAGGIGGLLAMMENLAANSQHSYYHADGNGNVTCLITTNQIMVAKALFDPFGNFLLLSGPKAAVNFYWFSSKPIHWPSGKYDFLYRWYAPQLQRWPNRDPIQERGGVNLYGFVMNQPLRFMDRWGLASTPDGVDWGGQGSKVPSKGNCWRFACGDPLKPGENHDGIPPGYLFDVPRPSPAMMCLSMMEAMIGKGARTPKKNCCDAGFHRITIQFSRTMDDPHFSREFSDGTWWDKIGDLPPEKRKGPKDVAPSYQKCGELCVPDGWDTDKITPKIP